MPGSVEGGKLAEATNKARYGEDYYKKMGKLGGAAPTSKPKGFGYMALHDPERLKAIGSRGGSWTRRHKKSEARLEVS